MTTQRTVDIQFDANIVLQDMGDHWIAYAEPTGLTVNAPTKDAAIDRVNEALRFFVKTVGQHGGIDAVRRYLDSHQVRNAIIESHATTPIKYKHAMDVLVEVPALA